MAHILLQAVYTDTQTPTTGTVCVMDKTENHYKICLLSILNCNAYQRTTQSQATSYVIHLTVFLTAKQKL